MATTCVKDTTPAVIKSSRSTAIKYQQQIANKADSIISSFLSASINEDMQKNNLLHLRDIDWRIIRFAVRDVILCHIVSRLYEKDNVIEVDVFMTNDPIQIPGWSGTKSQPYYYYLKHLKVDLQWGLGSQKMSKMALFPHSCKI